MSRLKGDVRRERSRCERWEQVRRLKRGEAESLLKRLIFQHPQEFLFG